MSWQGKKAFHYRTEGEYTNDSIVISLTLFYKAHNWLGRVYYRIYIQCMHTWQFCFYPVVFVSIHGYGLDELP